MLGKQWLNRYLRHSGGSVIERCGDRQRKCDGLDKWPFHLFVESLPVMLQVALLLLACGLCRYMESVSPAIAYTLFTLTGLGVLFYVGVVIAGASSHDCPFQTPASVPLRRLWKTIWPGLALIAFPVATALRTRGENLEFLMFRIIIHLPRFDILHHLHDVSEKIQLGIFRAGLCLPSTGLNLHHAPHHPFLPTTREDSRLTIPKRVPPRPKSRELAEIQTKNSNDVRCVSWVIKNITDPEALDAAIRCASTIWWFEDKTDMELLYNLTIAVFDSCFGPGGEVYPGLRDRTYYSLRAIIWIHVLAMCQSLTFPLPPPQFGARGLDDDLDQLLDFTLYESRVGNFGPLLLPFNSTPSHSRWMSNVLLYLPWAQFKPDDRLTHDYRLLIDQTSMSLEILLNRLLICCNLLGSPAEEELLKLQDTSYDISCLLIKLLIHCS